MHVVKPESGWSKSALASEFGIARQTVDKLLRGVPNSGTANGHPVWRIRDVAGIISDYIRGADAVAGQDPENMDPKSRKDWYDGEDRRLTVAQKKRELVSLDEMNEALALVFDALKTHVVTMPDVMERDVDLNAEQVVKMIELGDKLLNDFVEILLANAEDDRGDTGQVSTSETE